MELRGSMKGYYLYLISAIDRAHKKFMTLADGFNADGTKADVKPLVQCWRTRQIGCLMHVHVGFFSFGFLYDSRCYLESKGSNERRTVRENVLLTGLRSYRGQVIGHGGTRSS